jgi:hypothetical protein
MPLFYIIPFKLQSDAERKAQPKIVDFEWGNVLLYVLFGIVGLALFGLFVVVPAILALQQNMPTP